MTLVWERYAPFTGSPNSSCAPADARVPATFKSQRRCCSTGILFVFMAVIISETRR